MSSKKMIPVAVLGLVAISLAQSCNSARSHLGHDPAKVAKFVTWKVNDTLDDLSATEAQRGQVLAAKDHLLTAGLKLHRQHESARTKLERQWRSDHVNVEQLRELADQEIAELRAFLYQGIDALAEVHATFTPVQRATLADELSRTR